MRILYFQVETCLFGVDCLSLLLEETEHGLEEVADEAAVPLVGRGRHAVQQRRERRKVVLCRQSAGAVVSNEGCVNSHACF